MLHVVYFRKKNTNNNNMKQLKTLTFVPNSQTPIAQLHLHVPGAYDERTRTQTFLLAKAHVPVARCPCQIASTDDGDNHRLIQKSWPLLRLQPPPRPRSRPRTTQHDSRKRHLK